MFEFAYPWLFLLLPLPLLVRVGMPLVLCRILPILMPVGKCSDPTSSALAKVAESATVVSMANVLFMICIPPCFMR